METRPIVAGNLARQPVAKYFSEFKESQFPGADKIHNDGFYLGLSPLSDEKDIRKLIDFFEKFVNSY